MTENYIREKNARLRFWARNLDRDDRNKKSTRVEQMRARILGAIPVPGPEVLAARARRDAAVVRCKPDERTTAGKELTASELQLIQHGSMKPVARCVMDTLYEGTSAQNAGRARYLGLRGKIIPEEKFAHPIVSSWEYGWRLRDVEGLGARGKSTIYARSHIVDDTFYTRTGVPSLRAEWINFDTV